MVSTVLAVSAAIILGWVCSKHRTPGIADAAEDLLSKAPEPSFLTVLSDIEGDSQMVEARYIPVSEEEYDAYVESLKAAGFTHHSLSENVFDSRMYGAYDSEDMTNSISDLAYWYPNDLVIICVSDMSM